MPCSHVWNRRGFCRLCSGALAAVASTSPARAADRKPDDAPAPRGEGVRYPCYKVAGAPQDLGRQHGEQAREKIARHLEVMASGLKLARPTLRQRANQFRPLFQKHCPQLVPELQGLAEGAKISLADALAVNIRGALSRTADGGCTAFAVRKAGEGGGVLIGQNSDMLPAVVDLAYVLHVQPKDRPEAVMWTFGGMVGYHGLNEHAAANFANDLGGGPRPRFGMPHYPLKRRLLECRQMAEMLRLFRQIPLWANGNYVLTDGRAIVDVEATTAGPEVLPRRSGAIAHANHFLSSKYATAENHAQSAKDSFTRQQRMESLLRSGGGRATVADLKRFLRDRHGYPSGICRFAQTADPAASWVTAGITVASLIADTRERVLYVAAGNHPRAPFVAYPLEG